jgi:hypothetical protein
MGGRLMVELLDALAEICFRHGDAAPLQIFQTLSGGDALSLGAAQDSPSGILRKLLLNKTAVVRLALPSHPTMAVMQW